MINKVLSERDRQSKKRILEGRRRKSMSID